jgi:3-methyladenine DNA glycosylase AlkC
MPQLTKKEISGLMNSFQLYLNLPEDYYNLIQKQEQLDTDESKEIREKLIPIFNEIKKQEPDWDFTKKDGWWK